MSTKILGHYNPSSWLQKQVRNQRYFEDGSKNPALFPLFRDPLLLPF